MPSAKREIWREFVEQANGDPREHYSGCNMYGKQVLGIVLDGANLSLFYQELGSFLSENGHDFIGCLRTDSMGMDTIVYPTGSDYFEEADEEE